MEAKIEAQAIEIIRETTGGLSLIIYLYTLLPWTIFGTALKFIFMSVVNLKFSDGSTDPLYFKMRRKGGPFTMLVKKK